MVPPTADTPWSAVPDYENTPLLSDIIPAAALSLGAGHIVDSAARVRAEYLGLDTEARVIMVVLVDGMGYELLQQRMAHAPFLRSMLPEAASLSAGFPTTTANSLSSLGTGLLPGAHGVLGYRLLDPESHRLFNQLSWNLDVDPHIWVPDTTLFERLVSAGVDVVSLGEPKFAGRGLNRASLRGGRFRGSHTFGERLEHAKEELAKPGRRLIYFYWGNLDKLGHIHGLDSWEWLRELEAVDAGLAECAEALTTDASLLITADHGMVNVHHRIDIAEHPELQHGVRHVGGEARAVYLYTEAGAASEVQAAYSEFLGNRATVLRRDEAIRGGLFGPVADRNRSRIGDVLVLSAQGYGVVDSRTEHPATLALIGHHGGLSTAELTIPLLSPKTSLSGGARKSPRN